LIRKPYLKEERLSPDAPLLFPVFRVLPEARPRPIGLRVQKLVAQRNHNLFFFIKNAKGYKSAFPPLYKYFSKASLICYNIDIQLKYSFCQEKDPVATDNGG
jgi:hypothetical protein